jgi:hypothetical protein
VETQVAGYKLCDRPVVGVREHVRGLLDRIDAGEPFAVAQLPSLALLLFEHAVKVRVDLFGGCTPVAGHRSAVEPSLKSLALHLVH